MSDFICFSDGSYNIASVKLDLDPYPLETMAVMKPQIMRRPISSSDADPIWASPRSGAASAKSNKSLVPVRNMEPLVSQLLEL